ncbi:hypothetical protein LEMLEM_LOCUS562 [Lemmus lemmus]
MRIRKLQRPDWGLQEPKDTVDSRIRQQDSKSRLKSPIASLLTENSTLQAGAHFSLCKVRSQEKGWTRKATVLVESWHSNEFPEFQLVHIVQSLIQEEAEDYCKEKAKQVLGKQLPHTKRSAYEGQSADGFDSLYLPWAPLQAEPGTKGPIGSKIPAQWLSPAGPASQSPLHPVLPAPGQHPSVFLCNHPAPQSDSTPTVRNPGVHSM